MSDHDTVDRVRELFELLVNVTISAEQHQELESLLTDNPDAQLAYFELMDLHVGLHKLTANSFESSLQAAALSESKGPASGMLPLPA